MGDSHFGSSHLGSNAIVAARLRVASFAFCFVGFGGGHSDGGGHVFLCVLAD